MTELVLTETFKRKLKKKPPNMVARIMECIDKLADDPDRPGLRVKKMKGHEGIWEARVDAGNRLTFQWGSDGEIVLRTNCNHDILKRNP